MQIEDDELELGLALSLLEMKDHQLSTLSHETRFLQFGDGLNQSSSSELTSESQPQESSQETELHKSADVDKYVQKGGQMIGERCLNLSEEPKHRKNRRQRRKASRQKVVGLPCSLSAPPPVLLWFRRDLRLCDNPALIASLEYGAPIIPVFIWSPEEEEGPGITLAMGGASKFLDELVIIL